MATALELRQDRAAKITTARAILEVAESENRDFTQEETNQYDRLLNEANSLQQRAERMEQQQAMEAQLQQTLGRTDLRTNPNGRETQLAAEFFSRGMRGAVELAPDLQEQPEWRQLLDTTSEQYTRNFYNRLFRGYRALQADSDPAGGYLVAPLMYVDGLVKFVDDMVWLRQWGTVFAVPNADGLGVPSLDADPADANWTTELATGSEDSTMSFGHRELKPHPLAKRIKISNKLLMKVPNSEALVRERLAYKFGITQEKAFMTGSGAGQPLGVFTASASGISTGRDVSTGNTTTSIKFDGLIEAKYTLKPQYYPRSRWLFHRDALKQIAKLKDNDGQYLWRESVRAGEPDRLLGLPAFLSEYAPNTFTTGLYVGILGDFSNYWIADSMQMTMQRLVELYAATNQVGLIGRMDLDGMPVLEEAFVRVTLA